MQGVSHSLRRIPSLDHPGDLPYSPRNNMLKRKQYLTLLTFGLQAQVRVKNKQNDSRFAAHDAKWFSFTLFTGLLYKKSTVRLCFLSSLSRHWNAIEVLSLIDQGPLVHRHIWSAVWDWKNLPLRCQCTLIYVQFCAGLDQLLDENRIANLTLLYQLYTRVKDGRKELCAAFGSYIKVRAYVNAKRFKVIDATQRLKCQSTDCIIWCSVVLLSLM